MIFNPPLIPATLIKRYKRFLADVRLDDGQVITVHCPNTGSMKECWDPEWRVFLQEAKNPKRKYRYTWVIAQNPYGERIGVNTHLTNTLVLEALNHHQIQEIQNIESIQKEVAYGNENSRIDFKVQTSGGSVYIEIKNVTLKESDGLGYFPDAVTIRGQKHLRELISLAQSGQARAMLLFCAQHAGINSVAPARHIDPDYADLLEQAVQSGVEVVAYGCSVKPEEIKIDRKLNVVIRKF